eukprot:XP_011454323.1 PREDICTED: uncharacterized protein LOC105347112 [Crassostrea gigas]
MSRSNYPITDTAIETHMISQAVISEIIHYKPVHIYFSEVIFRDISSPKKTMLRNIIAVCLLTFATAAPNIRNDLMTCEICHVAVHDLQKLMAENATQATIEQRLQDICERLTSHVDDCLGFVKSKAPDIFKTLSQKMDPETICILLNVCPKPQDPREERQTIKIDTKKTSEEQVFL